MKKLTMVLFSLALLLPFGATKAVDQQQASTNVAASATYIPIQPPVG
ncbi:MULTISPECIES: hypothetical protein [Bacillaceae]